MTQMKYMKILVISLIAALGCCASVVASSASAEGGPLWGFCKLGGLHPVFTEADCVGTSGTATFELALLNSRSETLLLLAKGLNTQELVAATASFSINCNTLEGHGWLLGGIPGSGQGTIIYSGCSLPNSAKCDVSTGGSATLGVITTNQLEAELVYLSKTDAEALNPDASGTLFKPLGNTGNFVTIELHPLTSGACPVNGSAAVKGNVLTKNDEPLAKVLLHTILAEKPSITAYFLGKSGTEEPIKKLEIAGIAASYLGKVSLDVTELNGPSVAAWICP
jgi:hypothetical protein